MATLAGRKPSDTYKGLLNIDNGNSGIDGTLRTVQDGEGTEGTLQLSSTGVNVTSGLQYNGNAISVAGAFTFSGAYSFTATLTGATTVTFPTSGTLLSIAPATSSYVLVSDGSQWVPTDPASLDTSALPTLNISGAGSTNVVSTFAPTASTDYFFNFGTLPNVDPTDVILTTATFESKYGDGVPAPTDGEISNLYINCDGAGGSRPITITLQVNGVDTALTATDVGSTALDNVNTVSVTTGDLLRFKFTCTGTPSQVRVLTYTQFSEA
jgi:hypothetical protein